MSVVGVRRPMRVRRLLGTAVLVCTSAVLLTGIFTAGDSDALGWDFRVAYLPAAESVLEGRSPYPDPHDPTLEVGRAYAYPPPFAFALVPFVALPEDVAAFLAVAACLAALWGALYLVGVRDVRCFAVVPIWAAGWNTLEMANASAVVALLIAVCWRFRATVWRLGIALAGALSLKLFVWPTLIWLLATRRFRAAGVTVAFAFALTLTAWAALGFSGLSDYLDLLSRIAAQDSYSLEDIFLELGLGSMSGRLVAALAGSALLVICLSLVRRGDERGAFVAAVGAAFVLSPIVWIHYLVILVVPLGLVRRRFSALWLTPIVLWVSPRIDNGTALQSIVPMLVIAVVCYAALRRPVTSSVSVQGAA